MELLPKPKHPRMDACSKQDCQTMVDVASVKLAGQMTIKYDEKIREASKDTVGRVELMISNQVLRVKDELHSEIRRMQESMHVEIRKVLDERVSFITTKLERNTRTLDELQANLSTLKSDFAEHNERNVKELRSLDTRCQGAEDDSKKNTQALKQLRGAVEKLYDEFNRRTSE